MNRRLSDLATMLVSLTFLAAACTSGGTEDSGATDTDFGPGEFAMVADGETCLEPIDLSPPSAESAAVSEPTGATGDGVLTFGGVLPETGNLAFVGPAADAAAKIAIQDINAEGGVLGNDVAWESGDSGSDGETANQTVDGLLGSGSDVIVGAASSEISLTIVNKVTASNVVQISPFDSSSVFTSLDDNGLYFNTSASDVKQGEALANLMVADEATTAAFLVRGGVGETSFNQFARAQYEAKLGCVIYEAMYDPLVESFDAEIAAIAEADPDAIVVAGFGETAPIVRSLSEAGLGPKDKLVYGIGPNLVGGIGGDDASSLAGMRGVRPGVDVAESLADFKTQLDKASPGLVDYAYSADPYDAIIVAALASVVAETTDDGGAIGAQIIGVTTGGEKCSDFATCVALAQDGTDLDYEGLSGSLDFTTAGEASEAPVSIVEFDDAGAIRVIGSANS